MFYSGNHLTKSQMAGTKVLSERMDYGAAFSLSRKSSFREIFLWTDALHVGGIALVFLLSWVAFMTVQTWGKHLFIGYGRKIFRKTIHSQIQLASVKPYAEHNDIINLLPKVAHFVYKQKCAWSVSKLPVSMPRFSNFRHHKWFSYDFPTPGEFLRSCSK